MLTGILSALRKQILLQSFILFNSHSLVALTPNLAATWSAVSVHRMLYPELFCIDGRSLWQMCSQVKNHKHPSQMLHPCFHPAESFGSIKQQASECICHKLLCRLHRGAGLQCTFVTNVLRTALDQLLCGICTPSAPIARGNG